VFFSGEDGNIRFGMAAIRNVGESAIRSILSQRNSLGGFQSFTDFCEKVDHRVVNKRVIESLIKAGTFDSVGYRRAQIFEAIDRVIEGALTLQRDRESGQKNLFGSHIGKVITAGQPEYLPELSEWSESVRLAFEKEALGFYISGHPLQRFEHLLKECSQWTVQDLRESEGSADVSVGGVVVAPRFVKTKKGEPMATFQLEDLTGSVEVVVFPSLFAKRRELVAADRPVIVRGRFEQESEKVIRILASEIDTIEGLKERMAKALHIRTPLKMLSEESAERLMSLLKKNNGDCGVGIELLQDGGGRIRIESEQFVRVKPSIPLIQEIERICGEGSVHLAV
jgi:DNA polymerase-3 subunit alpha